MSETGVYARAMADGDGKPGAGGLLDVSGGQRVYWETWGATTGKPAVYLHGGPGSGFAPSALRFFDAAAYRIVLFDQRGCGRSTPHASDALGLSSNTTAHLVSDIERLREHLNVERWSVVGGSWGSTLALAYAERHSDRVSDMVLFSVTSTSQAEVDWITRGVGRFFPEARSRFYRAAALDEPDGSLADAYHRLLMHADPAIHTKAARDWCDWEIAVGGPEPRYDNAAFRLGFARLVTHYWRKHAWLADGELLLNAGRLADIPGVLIHGGLDLGSAPVTAWRISQAWPGSRLVIVEWAGHGSGHGGTLEQIRAATDAFASI